MNSIYFGVMFAMVVGLVANPIRNSALTRGDLTFNRHSAANLGINYLIESTE